MKLEKRIDTDFLLLNLTRQTVWANMERCHPSSDTSKKLKGKGYSMLQISGGGLAKISAPPSPEFNFSGTPPPSI